MTTMTKLLGAAAAIAMFAGAAQAADYAAPDLPSWTGAYIGVVGGYGWGDLDFEADIVHSLDTPTTRNPGRSIDVEGFLLGGQAGYDFDMGNGLVLGVAGDWSWSDMDGDTCVEDGRCDGLARRQLRPPRLTGSRRFAPGQDLPPARCCSTARAGWRLPTPRQAPLSLKVPLTQSAATATRILAG